MLTVRTKLHRPRRYCAAYLTFSIFRFHLSLIFVLTVWGQSWLARPRDVCKLQGLGDKYSEFSLVV